MYEDALTQINRTKEVRAQYNNHSRNSATKDKGNADKLAELTTKNDQMHFCDRYLYHCIIIIWMK